MVWNKIWNRLNLFWKILNPPNITPNSNNSKKNKAIEIPIITSLHFLLFSHKIEFDSYDKNNIKYLITLDINAEIENIVCIINETNLRGIR